jgi:hypothetical protein
MYTGEVHVKHVKVVETIVGEHFAIKKKASSKGELVEEKTVIVVKGIFGKIQDWYGNSFKPWIQKSWKLIVGTASVVIATIIGIALWVLFNKKSKADAGTKGKDKNLPAQTSHLENVQDQSHKGIKKTAKPQIQILVPEKKAELKSQARVVAALSEPILQPAVPKEIVKEVEKTIPKIELAPQIVNIFATPSVPLVQQAVVNPVVDKEEKTLQKQKLENPKTVVVETPGEVVAQPAVVVEEMQAETVSQSQKSKCQDRPLPQVKTILKKPKFEVEHDAGPGKTTVQVKFQSIVKNAQIKKSAQLKKSETPTETAKTEDVEKAKTSPATFLPASITAEKKPPTKMGNLVSSLASSLKINPIALMPGSSKPPAQKSSEEIKLMSETLTSNTETKAKSPSAKSSKQLDVSVMAERTKGPKGKRLPTKSRQKTH